ncbi:MAG: hypothetical protein J6D26_02325 [Clostridia bacterium]|nr:hypothetical protein [Clostridia bacterium]
MNKNPKNKDGTVKFPVPTMETGDMRLFPDDLFANAASANECTGLVQTAPAEDDVMEAYENIYSYKQPKPIKKEEE